MRLAIIVIQCYKVRKDINTSQIKIHPPNLTQMDGNNLNLTYSIKRLILQEV